MAISSAAGTIIYSLFPLRLVSLCILPRFVPIGVSAAGVEGGLLPGRFRARVDCSRCFLL